MEELIDFQHNLLSRVPLSWSRYLYGKLKTKERLLGLKGLRGVGKTTLLLQYLYNYHEKERGLYVTADHPWFYENTLFDLAAQWYRYNGKLLLIDEVHKYPNWSRELKLIYDGHPDLRVIFTSSSALDLYRGESDLSRRLITQTLAGLSFREYLSFYHRLNFEKITLTDLLSNANEISTALTHQFKPLPLFKTYLRNGYFPFAKNIETESIAPRLIRIINTVLESDLAYVQDYSASNIAKIKRLLGVLAKVVPFEPNISKIASKLQLGRNTVNNYLRHLQDAHILRLINKDTSGISALQKPDKIFFENTAFAYAFQNQPNIGSIRETFFLNQLTNAGHRMNLSTVGDFLADEQWLFEIGGRNKNEKQIKDRENAFLALDDIETGVANRIPLWLFGFLY